MTLSEFTLRIILIFLPGVISFIIVEQFIELKEIKTYRFFINSLILGFLCYLFYFPISLLPFLHFSFFQSLFDYKSVLDLKEIFITTLLAIPIGFIVAFLINRKILDKIGDKFRVTKKFTENLNDVWSYIMNSEKPGWVVVRDIENDLMYEGWIKSFSIYPEKDELYLGDVRVFTNSTAQLLYEIPGLYLPRKRESLTIEFPEVKFGEYNENQKKSQMEKKNEQE